MIVFSSKAPAKVPFENVRLAPKETAQSVEFKEGDEVEVRTQYSVEFLMSLALFHIQLPICIFVIFWF